MEKLEEFAKALNPFSSVYLDTSCLIYHLEDRFPYSSLTNFLLQSIQFEKIKGHTSVLSLLELNVKPYQNGRQEHAMMHVALFKNLPHFSIHEINLEIADKAAMLRAQYRFKTPDAIQMACALEVGCQVFVGNDKIFRRMGEEIDYLHLDDFV